MRSVRRARRPLVALVTLVVALAIGYGVRAVNTHEQSAPSGSPAASSSTLGRQDSVALSALPPQAAQTLRLIEQDGPFPYPRNDGAVFHNDEHRLPSEPEGYYREYTAPTPRSHDRGARRIVTGKNGEVYYTGDHYESLRRVDVHR